MNEEGLPYPIINGVSPPYPT